MLDVPGWPGHLAGQHVTARLTAADGYSTQRDYSIASAPEPGRFEVTVQRLADGEVSPYLTGVAGPGDRLEVRGPIGGWFAWHAADPRPLLLLAGGSGVVPLMSMIRTHAETRSQVPVRLIYSARTPADVMYQQELSERVRVSPLTVSYLYTRTLARPASAPDPAPDASPAWRPRPAPLRRPPGRRRARRGGLPARGEPGDLRLRPVWLRGGGRGPARRGGPRPGHHQDRTLRPHQLTPSPPAPARAPSEPEAACSVRGRAPPGTPPRRPRRSSR